MILYFQNSFGIRREIGQPETETEAYSIIHKFLEEHKFKSYYTRSWCREDNPKEKVYDVGSHSEFFICYNEEGWVKNE